MHEDSAGWLGTPGSIQDLLTELLRRGARGLIEKAVEAELQGLLDRYKNVTDLRGRQAVVRNGYLPERDLLTGLGPVPVRIPKVRDRSESGVKFNSALVPPYVRKTQRVEAALPWLYLRGISTGDMREALSVLLGDEAQGLSPAVVSRLKAEWAEAYTAWNRRDLSGEQVVYVWADGVYSALRGEDDEVDVVDGVEARLGEELRGVAVDRRAVELREEARGERARPEVGDAEHSGRDGVGRHEREGVVRGPRGGGEREGGGEGGGGSEEGDALHVRSPFSGRARWRGRGRRGRRTPSTRRPRGGRSRACGARARPPRRSRP